MAVSIIKEKPTKSGLDMAERTGLEPVASGVTGRRYNRLNYRSAYVVDSTGLEPVTPAV